MPEPKEMLTYLEKGSHMALHSKPMTRNTWQILDGDKVLGLVRKANDAVWYSYAPMCKERERIESPSWEDACYALVPAATENLTDSRLDLLETDPGIKVETSSEANGTRFDLLEVD